MVDNICKFKFLLNTGTNIVMSCMSDRFAFYPHFNQKRTQILQLSREEWSTYPFSTGLTLSLIEKVRLSSEDTLKTMLFSFQVGIFVLGL